MRYLKGGEEVYALRDVTLDVDSGEFLAVMGPSGSGKTTLLNLIAGLDKPTHGHVVVHERAIDQMSESELSKWRAKSVGFVFQAYNLLPNLTAEENVELPLLLTDAASAERRRRVDAVLGLVDLNARRRHRPAELSGGQQQRVAIARAFVGAPKLLICDEPTGNLDRNTSDQILDLLCLLRTQFATTVVMVTHDRSAAAFATRSVFFDKGEMGVGGRYSDAREMSDRP
jgi:putative ABC transport system ATP-binding protein